MIVKVIVNDVCTKTELDDLVRDCSNAIHLEYYMLTDNTYQVKADIEFKKCSLVKYLALKRYAIKNNNKVKVERFK